MAAEVIQREPYIGEKNKSLREGAGSYAYDNKFFKYEGQWKNGRKHGHGKLTFLDGSYYEGMFKNGEIDGFGLRYYAGTKCKYQGQFTKGELHGKGRMVWPDGSIYEGQWMNNKRQGFGIMKSVKENLIYKGSYFNNKRQGQGTMIYPEGDRYDGDWESDMRHGDGDMKYMDGTVYEGQFEEDFFNGVGTMRHCSGLVYNGIWKDGNPTILPTKLIIVNSTGKEPVEVIQGQPFDIKVKCVNEEGQVMEVDSGRELRIIAGFKQVKAKKGTALFDLIEEYEDKPIETPYYEVLQYPLTDFITEEDMAEEEAAIQEKNEEQMRKTEEEMMTNVKEEDEPVNPANQPDEMKERAEDEANPQEDGEKVTEGGEDPADETAPKDDEDPETAETPLDESMERRGSTLAGEGRRGSTLARSDSIVSEGQRSSITPHSTMETPLFERLDKLEQQSAPLPPPVLNKRSEKGECEWKNIQLAQAPPRFPPFVALDEEDRKTRARQNKQDAQRKARYSIAGMMSQTVTEDIDDAVEAKRMNRVSHDERFARVGEYVVMVHDVTTPPFMGQILKPAFISIKCKKPKREKKAPKDVKPKWDTSKHIANNMLRA